MTSTMFKRFGCLILALLLLLLCGCSLIGRVKETATAKQEEMDDLLVQFMTCVQNNDVMGAASLAYDPIEMQRTFSTITDYWPVKSTDTYEACGLNYHTNISNGDQSFRETRAVYKVHSDGEDYQVIMITRSDADGDGIVSFNVVRVDDLIEAGIEPETSQFPVAKKSFGQWCFTAFWILSCIACIVTIIDIVRKKPRLWGLWILCALFFFGFSLNKGPNNLNFGVKFGLLNSTEWVRTMDGSNYYQICAPLGAIIYWIRRKSLLKKKTAPAYAVPMQNAPMQTPPVQYTPAQYTPVQHTPAQNVPVQNIPVQNVPAQPAPPVNITSDPQQNREPAQPE